MHPLSVVVMRHSNGHVVRLSPADRGPRSILRHRLVGYYTIGTVRKAPTLRALPSGRLSASTLPSFVLSALSR